MQYERVARHRSHASRARGTVYCAWSLYCREARQHTSEYMTVKAVSESGITRVVVSGSNLIQR